MVGVPLALGGEVDPAVKALSDVVEVSCSYSAFAVRRVDGSVNAWGDRANGGDMQNVSPSGFTSVFGGTGAFVGLKATGNTGNIVTWGNPELGGELTDEVAKLTDIDKVALGNTPMAGLRRTG